MSWSIEHVRQVPSAPQEAWSAVSDLRLTPRLNPMIASVEVPGATSGVGATRRCHAKGPGALVEEVVEWEPPRRVVLRIVGGMPVRGEGTWRVDPADTGARVTFTYRPLPHLGPVGAVMHRAMRGQLDRAFTSMMDALAEHLGAVPASG